MEKEIPYQIVLQASTTGTPGRSLSLDVDLNACVPGPVTCFQRAATDPTARKWQTFGETFGQSTAGGTSNYNAGEVEVVKQFSNGMLFDALEEAVSRTRGLSGRKAILVLTDGVDEGSSTLSPAVAHDAQLANASVSALEFEPHGVLGILGSPNLVLKSGYDGLSRTSNGTGGVFLHAEHGKEQQQMQSIIELLKEQYVLEFTPRGSQPGFHQVAISVLRDAHLRTRKRFYQY